MSAASSEIPRRIRMDLWTPAEKAIGAAVDAVEAMPADPRLTDAVCLLAKAKDRVADFVDAGGAALGVGQCGHACGPCGIPGRRQRIAAVGRSFAHRGGARKQACAVYTRRIVEFDR